MFTIAFIPYRILTCFKRIITNAGAKLQIKNEIFLRSREKNSFLTFIPPIHYYIYWYISQWCARSHPFDSLWQTAVLGFFSLWASFFLADSTCWRALQSVPSSVILPPSVVALASGSSRCSCLESVSFLLPRCLWMTGCSLSHLLCCPAYCVNRYCLLKHRG